MRGGGEGSAMTDTVSATLRVTSDRRPLSNVTVTVSSSLPSSEPSRPGSSPDSFR